MRQQSLIEQPDEVLVPEKTLKSFGNLFSETKRVKRGS